jgi:hypothetical protein
MKNTVIITSCLMCVLVIAVVSFAQEADLPGSKDYPLLGRMPNFYISEYDEKDFDLHEFKDMNGEEVEVEGHKYYIAYEIMEGANVPSDLQVIRNYVNAVKDLGGTAYEEASYLAYMNLISDEKEIWIRLDVQYDGAYYWLTIIEKEEMVQELE